MKNDMQVKKHVLDMLQNLMMGSSATKLKPISMEVVIEKPVSEEEGSLEEVLDKAREDSPVEEKDDMDMSMPMQDDEEEKDDTLKMKGLRAFMNRK